MTVEELIRDIHLLSRELEQYEAKYGVLSQDFYRLYIEGKLPDEEPEQIDAFGSWAAAYGMKQRLEAMYQEAAPDPATALRAALRPKAALHEPGR